MSSFRQLEEKVSGPPPPHRLLLCRKEVGARKKKKRTGDDGKPPFPSFYRPTHAYFLEFFIRIPTGDPA